MKKEAKDIKITQVKEGWSCWVNTDLTEGKGYEVPIATCELKATALRLGKKKNVQGTDANIYPTLFFQVGNQWFGPVDIKTPTMEEIEVDRKERAKKEVLDKAKTLGLSDAEIKLFL